MNAYKIIAKPCDPPLETERVKAERQILKKLRAFRDLCPAHLAGTWHEFLTRLERRIDPTPSDSQPA
jgi:hypothetical protein